MNREKICNNVFSFNVSWKFKSIEMIIAPGMALKLSFSLNFQEKKNATKVHCAKSRVTNVIWGILITTFDLREKVIRKCGFSWWSWSLYSRVLNNLANIILVQYQRFLVIIFKLWIETWGWRVTTETVTWEIAFISLLKQQRNLANKQ